jgi:hypothetical protein
MAGATAPGTAASTTATGTGWPESPSTAAPGVDTPGWQPPAYRPPFAPGGPYAQSAQTGPYAGVDPYVQGGAAPADPYAFGAPYQPVTNPYDDPAYFPGLSPNWPDPGAPQPASPPPSGAVKVLRRVTLATTALVLGLLAILDSTGAVNVPAPAYFAAALATLGVGLMIGSLFGRMRLSIVPGIILVVGLLVSSVASEYHAQTVTIRPASVSEIPTTYDGRVQQLTIDLRNVDFRNQPAVMNVRLNAGMIVIEVPPNVDTHVMASVGAGDTMIFNDRHNSGVHARADVTDVGADGPGGGQLTINANITFAGVVEVKR